MKKNIKEKILITAKELFQTYGYNDVTMRNIADALHISVGNLTYHYKRKEDLIEAVIVDHYKEYKTPPVPKTLDELDRLIQKILTHQARNAYYFKHYTQLAQICPKVYQIQVNIIEDLRVVLNESFKEFQVNGWMKEEEFPGQTEHTLQILMFICLYGNVPMELDRQSCIHTLIYPLMTDSGKALLQST